MWTNPVICVNTSFWERFSHCQCVAVEVFDSQPTKHLGPTALLPLLLIWPFLPTWKCTGWWNPSSLLSGVSWDLRGKKEIRAISTHFCQLCGGSGGSTLRGALGHLRPRIHLINWWKPNSPCETFYKGYSTCCAEHTDLDVAEGRPDCLRKVLKGKLHPGLSSVFRVRNGFLFCTEHQMEISNETAVNPIVPYFNMQCCAYWVYKDYVNFNFWNIWMYLEYWASLCSSSKF